jgi:hypothetical protein
VQLDVCTCNDKVFLTSNYYCHWFYYIFEIYIFL